MFISIFPPLQIILQSYKTFGIMSSKKPNMTVKCVLKIAGNITCSIFTHLFTIVNTNLYLFKLKEFAAEIEKKIVLFMYQ